MSERIKLYLDEDVPAVIGEVVRAAGFDVLTTEGAQQRRAQDADQLSFAVMEDRAIFTHNVKHFVQLHELYLKRGWEHAGIIAAKRRFVVYDVARRLLEILKNVTADELRNHIRRV